MVDPKTLGLNLILLITGFFCVGAALCIALVLWVLLKIAWFRWRQQRAFAEYLRKSRAPDGRMYPPCMGGICQACGRVSRKVYYLKSGEHLCRTCYDASVSPAVGRRFPLVPLEAEAMGTQPADEPVSTRKPGA